MFTNIPSSSEEPIRFSIKDLSVTVSTESVSVVPANSKRWYLLIQNLNNSNVWINFGTPASMNGSSIKLFPQSTYILEDKIPVNEIFAIANEEIFLIVKEG